MKPARLIWILLIAVLTAGLFWYLNRPKPIDVVTRAAEMGEVEQTVANTRAGTVKACRRAADLPGSSADRDTALAALRAFIAERHEAIFGIDVPFGIPHELVNAASWEEFVERFPACYPSARDFRQR